MLPRTAVTVRPISLVRLVYTAWIHYAMDMDNVTPLDLVLATRATTRQATVLIVLPITIATHIAHTVWIRSAMDMGIVIH